MEDEQKQEMLPCHRERLADAFGLVTTAESSTITVFTNHRACGNCHGAIMLVAKIIGQCRKKVRECEGLDTQGIEGLGHKRGRDELNVMNMKW